MKNLIHPSLEHRWSIRESEGHHKKLKVAMMCPECFLGNVNRMHSDLVVLAHEIQFGEELGTLEFI